MLSPEAARSWYPNDPTHGYEHVLTVLRLAEVIAEQEGADLEIVRAAVLLHDATPPLSAVSLHHGSARHEHHLGSAEFARQVLAAEGWSDERIAAVQHCIRAHRFRDEREQPQTLEAQVLFDADKLDAIGARGILRALAYALAHGMPAYAPPSAQFLASGQLSPGEFHSAYHEFVFKLVRLKDRLFTSTARALAEPRHALMVEFFESLKQESQPD
jgi:uncharacterized protein